MNRQFQKFCQDYGFKYRTLKSGTILFEQCGDCNCDFLISKLELQYTKLDIQEFLQKKLQQRIDIIRESENK